MRIVLDASVALRWVADDGSDADRSYARALLLQVRPGRCELNVPNLWHLELSNVLARGLRSGDIDDGRASIFVAHIARLPVTVDSTTSHRALSETLTLARRHRLFAYDASYLELALRLRVPLATLDKDLRKALAAEGGALFGAETTP